MQTTPDVMRLALVGATLALLALQPAFGQANGSGATNSVTSGATAAPQAQAPDQQHSAVGRLSVNPVTGQTTAMASDYTPLTGAERWKLYFKQSYWSAGAYVGPLLAALALDQSTGDPKQWGGGFAGYGRRVASRVAAGDVVQNSFQFVAAAALKEDVRYIASDQPGFTRRIEHAILYSVLTYNSQGRPTPNLANIGGYYVASAASTLWLPGHNKVASYALSDGSEALALSVPVNMFQEFWPEISRKVLRRK